MSTIHQDTIPRKHCSKCDQYFPATAEFFVRDKNRKDGLYPLCKACKRKVWHDAHPPVKETVPEGYKHCSKCLQDLPATAEYFQVDKGEKDGFRYICKDCRSKRLAKAAPPGLKRCTKCKTIYPATIKFFRSYSRGGFRPHCRKCESKENRAYNAAHAEDYGRYRKMHRDRILEGKRHYRETHKEEIIEKERQTYQLHHERFLIRARVSGHKRRAIKRNVGGSLTAKQIQDKLKAQHHACYYCKGKFERRKDGTYIYHLEHTVPLSRIEAGPRHDINFVVLACPTCNMSKKNKLPHEWPQGGRLL